MNTNPLIQQLNSYQNPQYAVGQQLESAKQYKSCKTLKIKKAKCIVCRKLCNYTCPKCKFNYCGIQHYRSHNLFCSQKFYENQVTDSLKGLKVTDKKQKKKAIEIVRNYQQQMQNESITFDITVERLQQILAQIQSQKQPKLTPKQQYLFNKYLQTLNRKQNSQQNSNQNQEQVSQIEKPFWQIEDGMGIYLLKQTEIQEFGESQYPQIIAQRQLFKKRIQQFNQIHPYTETIFRPIINLHLIQIIYQFVTLFRAFDGQYQQFAFIFASAYTSKQNQNLLTNQQVTIADMIKQIDLQITKIYNQINGISNQDNIIKIWINQYFELICADMVKIMSNKYLISQNLLRIIDTANLIYKQQSQTKNNNQILQIVNKISQNNNKKLSKQQKMLKIMKLKIVKKCEYLLYFIQNNFKQNIIQQILQNITHYKKTISQQSEKEKQFPLLINKNVRNN